jgi:hypothetical protein
MQVFFETWGCISSRCERSSSNYGLSCPLRGREICATVPQAQHIFFGSAMGQLEQKLDL